MPLRTGPDVVSKARWHRARGPVLLALALATVVSGVFVSLGLAALLFMLTLGLATFTGGSPDANGPTSPPSVRGTFWGG